MFALRIEIENGKVFDKLARTGHAAAVRNGLNKAAGLWRKKFAPLHFKEGAAQKYGYRKRTAAYQRRKLRNRGHSLPLVDEGKLREAVTKDKVRRQKTGPDSIDLILRLPTKNGANYARFNPQLPPGQIIREVLTTTPEEEKTMGEEFGNHYAKKMARDLKKHKSSVVVKA